MILWRIVDLSNLVFVCECVLRVCSHGELGTELRV